MDRLLPQLSVPEDLLTRDHSLDPASLFARPFKELWFEIGFGAGEQLRHWLQTYPDNAYIGAEPFINGMAGFLTDLPCPAPGNLRVLMDDALLIGMSLRRASVDRIYVLNPDPWPKKRHNKRRMIRPDNLDVFADIIKPGGRLIMATDVDDLADWMVTHSFNHPAFEWEAQTAKGWRERPPEIIATRYAEKGANNSAHRQIYLTFRRK